MKDTLLFALQATIMTLTVLGMSIIFPVSLALIFDGPTWVGIPMLVGGSFCGSVIVFATFKWMRWESLRKWPK